MLITGKSPEIQHAEEDLQAVQVEQKAFDLWCHWSNFLIKTIGRGRGNPTIAITQMSFSPKVQGRKEGDCVVLRVHGK